MMSWMVSRSAALPVLAREQTIGVPWYIWTCVIAVTCGSVGSVWDISWHKSIGRDSFWTAAHILIYLCGVMAGFTCAYVILSTTFGADQAPRAASVKVWGFRGPLGAFVCAWGGIAMIASAPFDDWWHNAYGLDVRVLSPPHVVLMFGMIAIRFGALLFIIGELHRATGRAGTILRFLLLYSFVSVLAISLGAFQEWTIRTNMHSARFYFIVSLVVPVWLAAASVVSGSRWAYTATAAIYTGYLALFVWILPLFPAEPKLGPVYQNVTRLIPPDFPLLLIVPAFAIDLVRRSLSRPGWRLAILSGSAFVVIFVAAQWPFAVFLQSPAARNWIFGTQHVPFFVPSNVDYVQYVFTALERSASEFWLTMVCALAAAIVMTRIGLAWGVGLHKLQR